MGLIRLTEELVENMLAAPSAILYKHSPICSLSSDAIDEVEYFNREHPDLPVYIVDVIAQRPLSQYLAAHLVVQHKSPQAILLRYGKPVWHDSHWRVQADRLSEAIGETDLK